MEKTSLFERLGGKDAVEATVNLFYEKVLNDPLLKDMFREVDVEGLMQHQTTFMTQAFGGQPLYKGKALRRAHAGLVEKHGLSDAHFDAVALHLTESLQELNVPENLISEVMAIVATTRDDVLNR